MTLAHPSPSPAVSADAAQPSPRLLLVEDNPADFRLIELHLREHPSTHAAELLVVRSLAAAQRALASPESAVDLVLLDLSLPDSEGLETLEAIRAAGPRVPVVVLSGRADEGLALEAVRRGAQDYLVKGHVGADSLARAIRYAIERNRIEVELAAQRKTVEHMSRLSALGEMAATFAHELNQPLSAILLSAEEARSLVDRFCGMEAAKLREPLAVVSTQARRAAEIIRRIRGFAARSQSGPTLIDVGQLIQDSCGLMQPELAHRRVRLAVDAPVGLASVQGDPLQLRQVLVNLLMNALEAMERTPAAQREVAVSAKAMPTGVEVAVRDHGHGVTPENLAGMMEPFFTTKREGLGLGLSISRSIIESHSGRLSAEANSDGVGMTFRFVLPRTRRGAS